MPVLHIALFDDSSPSREQIYRQLRRDARGFIDKNARFATPAELIAFARDYPLRLDVILIDTEYRSGEWSLERLIAELRELRPDCSLVCLTEYGDEQTVRRCIQAKADGILSKADVQYGVASALLMLNEYQFLYSDSLKFYVRRYARSLDGAKCVPTWEMYSRMSPALAQLATLLFIEGLSTEVAADAADLSHTAIAPYKHRATKRLAEAEEEGWYDLRWKQWLNIDTSSWSSDRWYYHLLTSLPANSVM